MRFVVATLALFALLPSRPALAQNAVLVDRDALAKRLRDFHEQLEQLQRQAQMLTPPGAQSPRAQAAWQLQQGLQSLNQQIHALAKDIRSLPPAAPSVAAQLPSIYVPPSVGPTPVGSTVVVQGNYPPPQYPVDPVGPSGPTYVPPPPPAPAVPAAIDDETFSSLLQAISDQGFSDDKLRVLSDGAQNQFFRVAQVEQVLPALPFSKDKLRALEILAPKIVDRQNTFKLYNQFPFSADKEKARRILSR